MRRLARLLLYVGIVGAVVSLSLIHAEFLGDPPYSYTGTFRFGWSLIFMLTLGVSAYGVGLPDLPRSAKSAVASALAAAGLAAVAISLLQLVVGDALLPRFVVFGSALLLVPWYLLCVALAGGGRTRAEAADLVVVVAPDADGDVVRSDLQRWPERPATVVAVIDPAEAAGAERGGQPLVALVEAHGATVVVLDRGAQADDRVVNQAALLHERGVRVRTLSLFYEEWLGKLPVFELERVSLMFDIGEVHRARYGRVKRVIDVIIGGLAMVVLLVLLPFVWLGNLVANRGPLFFHQPRTGKGGHEFEMLKLRTMRPGSSAGEWTAEDDPRITPLGRVLRVTHLDELPQAVNIFRGDLSVVGPRPEQPHYVSELTEKLPFYDLRHLVRPGLTGWAQVKYGYASDDADALEKLQYDFYYLRHQNVRMDLRIVGRTLRSVLGREGR
jgi:lipopolysaccharide/colanic/teichoic acid biosynthesis glycosyltransferase